MKVIHIVGQPGSGKTTLITEIIPELNNKGIRVGTIKHSSHAHELDKKGKDSYLHRKAGASPVTMMTQNMTAVYLPCTKEMTPQTMIETYYSQLDVVLIEGWISGPYPKIEVIRPCVSTVFLFTQIDNVSAIISDESLPESIQKKAESQNLKILPRNHIAGVTKYILEAR